MKYILIIAENGDSTVDEVCHWIKYTKGYAIERINETDQVDIINILTGFGRNATFKLVVNNRIICSENIHSYWYRRGGLRYRNVISDSADLLEKKEFKSLNKYYLNEWKHTANYLHYILKNSGIKNLNSYFDVDTNKLINMSMAQKAGLNIPNSIVTNSKGEIEMFLSKYEKVIVKPIRCSSWQFRDGENSHVISQYTNLFTMEDLDNAFERDKIFQPTLFQEYIEKQFEIRSFYLKGKIFSMAIFSQKNDKTKVDFRNYDTACPNRNIPFKLPTDIEDKIRSLMTILDYDTGSIDLIYGKESYTFLEVNTMGQLSWVSKNCNYNIEKEIANYLTT